MTSQHTKQILPKNSSSGNASINSDLTAQAFRKKQLAIVTFKYVETHPRVNRIANTFKECDYDVTVYGLSHKPSVSTNSNGIKFVTFPMRSTIRSQFTNLVLFPIRFIMGTLAAITLIYCQIRKI